MNDLLERLFLNRKGPGCSCDMCLAIPSIRPCEVRDLVRYADTLEKVVEKLLAAETEADTQACLYALRAIIDEA